MEMNQQEMSKGKVCNCPHHKAKPIGIILIGVVILLGGLSVISFQAESVLVGILAIIIGATKWAGSNCKCC